ncbi:hypothetical protein [Nonomuraea sp. NPDC049141]|uniref:hypothetical protein n=1 Tax=Nonomuraea sp. NPDC049141 TaxID=3155500 RepID=UPI0033F3E9D5
MGEGQGALQPTPSMMPKRRAAIPAASMPPARSSFQVASQIPQRGWQDAYVWPDTGVLLGLGTQEELPTRFRERYGNRVRVAEGVVREVRSHSDMRSGTDASPDDHTRVMAARLVYRKLLLDDASLPVVSLKHDDLLMLDQVAERLRALSADPLKKHGGEAQIIVLAVRQMARDGRPHILLTNDGGASVVASNYGLPSRHLGDILAELSCSDRTVKSTDWFAQFQISLNVSAPPFHSRQRNSDAFECQQSGDGCGACDGLG